MTRKSTRLIRLPELKAKVGLCKSQIYKMMAKGLFPSKIQLSVRAVAWLEEQIDDWIVEKLTTQSRS